MPLGGGGGPEPPVTAVPVTVIGNVADAAAVVVVTFKVDVPPELTDVGVSVAVTPDGAPLADRLTDSAEPLVTAVLTVVDTELPAATDAEFGDTEIEKSFVGGGCDPPVVNGWNVWLNCHVDCAIPEQVLLPAVPTQPPLSRWTAHMDSELMPLETAQFSTVVASLVVKVSAAPKSSMPGISVTPTIAHSCVVLLPGSNCCNWLTRPLAAVMVSLAISCVWLSK